MIKGKEGRKKKEMIEGREKQALERTCTNKTVVSFDQVLGAAHSKSWSKSHFPCFLHVLARLSQVK